MEVAAEGAHICTLFRGISDAWEAVLGIADMAPLKRGVGMEVAAEGTAEWTELCLERVAAAGVPAEFTGQIDGPSSAELPQGGG